MPIAKLGHLQYIFLLECRVCGDFWYYGMNDKCDYFDFFMVYVCISTYNDKYT